MHLEFLLKSRKGNFLQIMTPTDRNHLQHCLSGAHHHEKRMLRCPSPVFPKSVLNKSIGAERGNLQQRWGRAAGWGKRNHRRDPKSTAHDIEGK